MVKNNTLNEFVVPGLGFITKLKNKFSRKYREENKQYINPTEVKNEKPQEIKKEIPCKKAERRTKAINQYELDGTYIRTYQSIKEAKLLTFGATGNINAALSESEKYKGIRQAGGYMWRYDNGDHSNIEPYIDRTNKAKRVVQVDQNTDKVIGVYKSLREAEKITGATHIWSACNGRRKTSGGYKWVYYDEYVKDLIQK